VLQLVNLALKFGLELTAFVSVAYSAFQAPLPLPLRLLAAAAAVAVLAAGWGRFLAPTARSGLSRVQKDVLGGLVLLLAAAALAAAGQPTLAFVYAAAVVVNAALLLAHRHQPLPAAIGAPRG